MIFVTVGSMVPFDRLVAAMDEWSSENPSETVFAQIGDGSYIPKAMRYKRMLTPAEFAENVSRASLIVAHAGMGSVITAAELGKPIILCPRRFELEEHTTDHQLHTVKWLKARPGVYIANDKGELDIQIPKAIESGAAGASLPRTAPVSFVNRLRQEILQ